MSTVRAFADRHPAVYPALTALALWAPMAAYITDYRAGLGVLDAGILIPFAIWAAVSALAAAVAFVPAAIAHRRRLPTRTAVTWLCLLALIPVLGWVAWAGLVCYAALAETTP